MSAQYLQAFNGSLPRCRSESFVSNAGYGCIDGDRFERLRRARERLGSLYAVHRGNDREFEDCVNFNPAEFDKLLEEIRSEIEKPRDRFFEGHTGPSGPRAGRCAVSTEDRLFLCLWKLKSNMNFEVSFLRLCKTRPVLAGD